MRQFAELMEVTYHTVLRWVHEERVHVVTVGGQRRIYQDEIEHQLRHGTRPPNPEKLGTFGKENKRGNSI
jgi:excisionase family DNA binding protein